MSTLSGGHTTSTGCSSILGHLVIVSNALIIIIDSVRFECEWQPNRDSSLKLFDSCVDSLSQSC